MIACELCWKKPQNFTWILAVFNFRFFQCFCTNGLRSSGGLRMPSVCYEWLRNRNAWNIQIFQDSSLLSPASHPSARQRTQVWWGRKTDRSDEEEEGGVILRWGARWLWGSMGHGCWCTLVWSEPNTLAICLSKRFPDQDLLDDLCPSSKRDADFERETWWDSGNCEWKGEVASAQVGWNVLGFTYFEGSMG